MKIIFSESAWEDYLYWQQTDKPLLKRTNELIHPIVLCPLATGFHDAD